MTSSEIITKYNSAALAYIGDAVYELLVRKYALGKSLDNGSMHRLAKEYVSAGAQCRILAGIQPLLTETESDIVRRGRNCKPKSRPKNADIAQYHSATGFEALWGYLFLLEDYARIEQLFNIILKIK